LKQTIIIAVLALAVAMTIGAPAMAQTNNTNDHWNNFEGCNAAAVNNMAAMYEPGIKNPQKADETKEEKLVSYSSGSCAYEHTKYGLVWIWRNAEFQDLQRPTGLYDPRCNNKIEDAREVVVPTGTAKTDKPTKPADNSELATRIEAGRVEAWHQQQSEQRQQQSGLGNCAMVLAAQRQQYLGDPRKKSVAISCKDDNGTIVVTASDFKPVKPAGNCGFLCRFFTEPAVIPGYVSGGGYGYNTYYGGGGGGYNRNWHSGNHSSGGVPPSGSTGPVLGGNGGGTAPSGTTGSGVSGNTGNAFARHR
jgi:hypothetical protein